MPWGQHVQHIVHPQAGESVTARAMAARSIRYAAVLQSLGVRSGDKVVVCCGSHPHFFAIVLGTICCGAALAPLNHNFDSGDLGLLLGNLQPRVVFSLPETADRLRPLLSRMASTPELVVMGQGAAWEKFQTDSESHVYREPEIVDIRTTVAAVMCSGGTTGLPKGVQITHANLMAALSVFKHKDSYTRADDIMVITSPAYWVTGLVFSLSSMERGTRIVFEYGATEERLLASIEAHKATMLFAANNFLLAVAQHPSSNRYNLSSLRIAMCGGAAMGKDTERMVERLLGVPVVQVYGMTEILFGCGSTNFGKRHGSVGAPVPYMSFKVVDPESGLSLGREQPGELMFKGPEVSLGYLNNPEATAATFTADGWVHSGDIGYMDQEGNIFVTGRIKDAIKYRGDHVSPVELESVLLSHPNVLDVAVVGVPHPTDQELPRAYVVRKAGATVTAEELGQLITGQLAPHKWLRGGVHFLDSMPKTPVGKIDRTKLRRLFSQEA